MLARRERKQRHLAAAVYLQQAFSDDSDEMAELIATHYLDAYRAASNDADTDVLRGRTLDALRHAARRASTIGASEVAQRAFEQASELAEEPERATLIQAAGEMAVYTGRTEAAIRLLDLAADAYRRTGRPARRHELPIRRKGAHSAGAPRRSGRSPHGRAARAACAGWVRSRRGAAERAPRSRPFGGR